MQEAVPSGEGAMLAVLGISSIELDEILNKNKDKYECFIANDNSRLQVVVSGLKKDINLLSDDLYSKKIKNLKLNVSAPFHCKYMKKASERIALRGFEIARKLEKNKVVLHAIHKANVLRITDGIFLKACRKMSKKFPEITYKEMLVDAATAHLIKNPTQFDVIVTTNMFGDILSDLASELSGSLGMGGSLNVGDGIPMAQAQHGSASDIEKKGIANPLSLIFSTGLMFNWIGYKKNDYKLKKASYLITNSINKHLLEKKYLTFDLGGNASTSDVINSIIEKL